MPREKNLQVSGNPVRGSWWNNLVNDYMSKSEARLLASYTVYASGSTYYGIDEFSTLKYGGPDDEGGIDGANAEAVIEATFSGLSTNRSWKETVLLKGNIEINGAIDIPSYTTVVILNRVKVADSADVHAFQNSDRTNGNNDIEIIGGTIDGNRTNQTPKANLKGVYFVKVTDGLVKDCYIKDFWRNGVYGQECNRIKVLDNTIINCGYWVSNEPVDYNGAGIFFGTVRSNEILVANNYLYDNPCMGMAFSCDYVLTLGNIVRKGNRTGIDYYQCFRSAIVGNVVEDYLDLFVGHGSMDVSIIGNESYNNKRHGILIWPEQPSGDVTSRITVVGNTCYNNTEDGIHISSNCFNITVNGNVCRNNSNGIKLSAGAHSVVLSDNVLEANTTYGIYGWGVSDMVVEDNICKNNGNSGINFKYTGSITENFLIQGNYCFDDQGTKTQLYGIYLDWCDYVAIIGNNLRGNVTGGFDSGGNCGTNMIFRDNIGYVTENNVLSGTFLIDSTGLKSVTISHGCDYTPSPEHVQITIVEDTDVDDWYGTVVKIKDITSTQLTIDVQVVDASATSSATAKLSVRIARN